MTISMIALLIPILATLTEKIEEMSLFLSIPSHFKRVELPILSSNPKFETKVKFLRATNLNGGRSRS